MREYIHVEDAALASIKAMEDDFLNQHVVLSGQEPMRVLDLLKMLAEILGYPQTSIKFIESEHIGHYIRTPYAYQPKLGRKYVIERRCLHELSFYTNIYDLFLRLKMKDFIHNIINNNPDIIIINLDELAHKLTKIFP